MLKTKEYFFQSSFLIAIFIVGNTLIYFPKHNDIKSSILGVLIAAVVSLLIYIAFAFLTKKVKNIHNFKRSKPMVLIIITVCAVLVALISASDYISYVSLYRMPQTPKLLISVLFIALCIFLANSSREVILKLSLVVFIYVFLSVTVLFILSFSQLDFKAALPLEFKGFETAKSFLTIVAQSFLSAVVLIMLLKSVKTSVSVKMWLLGLVFGLFVLMVCMLNILFVFGPDLSNRLELPYASAMSVINMGKTFARLEGFSYLNYFACSLIKASASLWVIKSIFEDYFKRKGLYILLPTGILLIGLSLINNISDFLYSISFSFVLLIVETTALAFMGVFYKRNLA